MKSNRTNRFLTEIMRDMRNTSKYLSEAYIFDDEEDMREAPMGDEEGYYDEEEYGEPRGMERPSQGEGGNGDEEKAMHAQEIMRHEPIIGKIRETAIEGLKKYSDDPTSEIYEFFKKVFLDADKVLVNVRGK